MFSVNSGVSLPCVPPLPPPPSLSPLHCPLSPSLFWPALSRCEKEERSAHEVQAEEEEEEVVVVVVSKA